MATRGGKFQSAGGTKAMNLTEKCSHLSRGPVPRDQTRRFLRGGNNPGQSVLFVSPMLRSTPSRGPPIKLTGRGELTVAPVGSGSC